MRVTIYLPEELASRVNAHLKARRDTTLSRLVREALERHLGRPDPKQILKLAGLVSSASVAARDKAEDRLGARER